MTTSPDQHPVPAPVTGEDDSWFKSDLEAVQEKLGQLVLPEVEETPQQDTATHEEPASN